jgi:hypothetical protein
LVYLTKDTHFSVELQLLVAGWAVQVPCLAAQVPCSLAQVPGWAAQVMR